MHSRAPARHVARRRELRLTRQAVEVLAVKTSRSIAQEHLAASRALPALEAHLGALCCTSPRREKLAADCRQRRERGRAVGCRAAARRAEAEGPRLPPLGRSRRLPL